MKNIKKYMLLLVICVLSNWTWEIFKDSFLDLLTLFILMTGLFLLTFYDKLRLVKVVLFVTLLLFCFISYNLFKNSFDQSLITKNPTETKTFYMQHSYLANGLGYLFTNKVSLNYYTNWYYPISNYLRNISYCVDINLYFFSSHPREKAGIDEFVKFSLILLPFFILGFLLHVLSLGKYKYLTVYLIIAVIVTAFVSPGFNLGPILLYPYVNIIIFLGVKQTIMFKK